jgi:hypothetical protein
MAEAGRNRTGRAVYGVAIGLAAMCVAGVIGLCWRFSRSAGELRIDNLIEARQGEFGFAVSRPGVTLEYLSPSCSRPHVIVSGTERYRTRLLVCVFVIRLINGTKEAVDLGVSRAVLVFDDGRKYADLPDVRRLSGVVPPHCTVMVAVVFELVPNEGGKSSFKFMYTINGQDDEVDHEVAPLRTSSTGRSWAAQIGPGAVCPPAR